MTQKTKHKCEGCGKVAVCVDCGVNAWACADCLRPFAQSIADSIDQAILEKLLKESKEKK